MAERTNPSGEPRLAEARRAIIVEMLRANGSVTVAEVQARLGVSPMTARRDLTALSRRGLAQRTYGGAVIPSIVAQEDSFNHRLDANIGAKGALAEAAAPLLSPRDAAFLDSSTTSYFVASRLLELEIELTIITNSLPVMGLVATHAQPNVELVAIGGILRKLTQSFVGPHAIRTIHGHFTDRAFLSVTALTEDGVLADVDPLQAEVKRNMIAHAHESILLVDRSKLAARGLHAIGPISDISLVLAHGIEAAELRDLQQLGAPIRLVDGRNGGSN